MSCHQILIFTRYVIVVLAIVFGLTMVFFAFYQKFAYDMAWGSPYGSHVKPFPGHLVLIGLAMFGWGLGDLWLHGGLKTRLKAKRQSDKDPAEQGQTEHAQTLAEDAGPEQAPTMQKPPTEP